MLLLRVGVRGRWIAEAGVDLATLAAKAAADLELGPGEEGLSVFRVEGREDSSEVALRFALTCRDDPRHTDYIRFPSDLAESLGLTVRHVSVNGLDPFLNARHHEIFGLTPGQGFRLASAILADDRRRVERFPKGELEARGAELCERDPGFTAHLKPGIVRKLPGLLGDKGSGC